MSFDADLLGHGNHDADARRPPWAARAMVTPDLHGSHVSPG
ncbi:MAG: hypothetical protein AB7N65_28025 [Vicinamibacterales bacterium]